MKPVVVPVIGSIVPFSRFDDGRVYIFTWRAHTATRFQSSQFFHDIIVPLPDDQQVITPSTRLSLLAEHFTHLTAAAFFPAKQLAKRISSGVGVLQLPLSDPTYLIPVRPIAAVQAKEGSGCWVAIDDIAQRLGQTISSPDSIIDCCFNGHLLYLLFINNIFAHLQLIRDHFVALGLPDCVVEPIPALDDVPTALPLTPRMVVPDVFFTCAKCNKSLFNDQQIESHSPGRGFRSSNANESIACKSFFLREGIDVFGPLSELQGKIACPACHSRLGSFDWSGSQCSCGQWISPALQITTSKVDRRVPRQPRQTGTDK